jgi:hypothetical protein
VSDSPPDPPPWVQEPPPAPAPQPLPTPEPQLSTEGPRPPGARRSGLGLPKWAVIVIAVLLAMMVIGFIANAVGGS